MALELLRIDPATAEETLADPTYFGYAAAGTQDTEAKWTIKKRVIVGGVAQYQYPYISGARSIEANPSVAIDNQVYIQASGLIWASRTGYTYQ